MTPFVLDASVTVAWSYHDQATEASVHALELLQNGATAYVPTIWRYEVTSALLRDERRQKRTPAETAEFIELLARLTMEEVEARSAASLLSVARHHELRTYDATYLALAQRLAIPIATNDERLREAARAGEVELI